MKIVCLCLGLAVKTLVGVGWGISLALSINGPRKQSSHLQFQHFKADISARVVSITSTA